MGVHSTTVLHFQLSCIIFYFSVSDPFEMNFVWYQKVDFFSLCMQMYASSVCLEGIFLLCCVLLLFQRLFYQTTVMCFFFWPHYSLLSLSVVVSVLLLQRDTKIMVTLTKKKKGIYLGLSYSFRSLVYFPWWIVRQHTGRCRRCG